MLVVLSSYHEYDSHHGYNVRVRTTAAAHHTATGPTRAHALFFFLWLHIRTYPRPDERIFIEKANGHVYEQDGLVPPNNKKTWEIVGEQQKSLNFAGSS